MRPPNWASSTLDDFQLSVPTLTRDPPALARQPREEALVVADQRIRGVDILKGGGCSEIYLFGSVAEGRVTTRSDIDFAGRGCPPNHFFKLQGKLLMELGRSVDLVNLDTDADLASFLEREATLVDVG